MLSIKAVLFFQKKNGKVMAYVDNITVPLFVNAASCKRWRRTKKIVAYPGFFSLLSEIHAS